MKKWNEYQHRWRRRKRRGKQVLLIALRDGALQAACWLDGCCLWRKQSVLENRGESGEMLAAAEAALRDILLEAAAAENLDTVLRLASEQVNGERLTLPLVSEREMRQAVAWEAKQLAPWPVGTFSTAFAVEEITQQAVQVRLWAMEAGTVQDWRRLAGNLQLRLRAILPDRTEAAAQREWYDGAAWAEENLLNGVQSWDWRRWEQSPCWRAAAIASFLLSLLIYAGANGGRYLALQSARECELQMQRYDSLRQSYAYSMKLGAELERCKGMERNRHSADTVTSGKLEQLSRQLEPGCWLQSVQSNSGQWQVEGRAADIASVHRLVRRWQENEAYGQVELLRSQQEKDGAGFALRFKERKS